MTGLQSRSIDPCPRKVHKFPMSTSNASWKFQKLLLEKRLLSKLIVLLHRRCPNETSKVCFTGFWAGWHPSNWVGAIFYVPSTSIAARRPSLHRNEPC